MSPKTPKPRNHLIWIELSVNRRVKSLQPQLHRPENSFDDAEVFGLGNNISPSNSQTSHRNPTLITSKLSQTFRSLAIGSLLCTLLVFAGHEVDFQHELNLKLSLIISTLQYSLQILLSDDSSFSVDYVDADSKNISEEDIPVLVNHSVAVDIRSQIPTIGVEPLNLFFYTNDPLTSDYDNILRHSIQLLNRFSLDDVEIYLV